MISEGNVKSFVREGELKKIENYDKAIADKKQTWHCHHRLELTLGGEFAHSKEELKRLGMYYKRPYFELIFLTPTEHKRLHSKAQSDETKKKLSEARKRRIPSEEHKKNLSKPRSDFGKKYFDHFGYSRREDRRQYGVECRWYLRHNRRCRWE